MTKYVIIKDIFVTRPKKGDNERKYFMDKENESSNLKYLKSDEMTLIELYEYAIEDHLEDLKKIKDFVHSEETILKIKNSLEFPSFMSSSWGVDMWFINKVIIQKVNVE